MVVFLRAGQERGLEAASGNDAPRCRYLGLGATLLPWRGAYLDWRGKLAASARTCVLRTPYYYSVYYY